MGFAYSADLRFLKATSTKAAFGREVLMWKFAMVNDQSIGVQGDIRPGFPFFYRLRIPTSDA